MFHNGYYQARQDGEVLLEIGRWNTKFPADPAMRRAVGRGCLEAELAGASVRAATQAPATAGAVAG
ncbi:hypothetical protein AO265_11805 [Pseudomonas sp. ABAC61]|nr:hypothetical protein AO265_11805 [Pseudomonas sp. ABAC61]